MTIKFAKPEIKCKTTFHIHLRALSRTNFARLTFNRNPMTYQAKSSQMIWENPYANPIEELKEILPDYTC